MSGEGKPLFAGKYKFVRNEHFDEYLSANGANWIVRKMACSASPVMTIEQNENQLHIKLVSVGSTKETKFTVGEEFEETQMGGDAYMVKPEWEGEKLVLTYTPKVEGKGKPQKVTRELNEKDFVVTMEVGDVVGKRHFVKEV